MTEFTKLLNQRTNGPLACNSYVCVDIGIMPDDEGNGKYFVLEVTNAPKMALFENGDNGFNEVATVAPTVFQSMTEVWRYWKASHPVV